MEEINNLIYSMKINYTDNSGVNVSICRQMDDKGLEINSVKVGDECITEETTNGRVLSGRYDSSLVYCGYKYNYEKSDDEYLVNINKDIMLETAISLINRTKMKSDFLSAKMVLSAISRQDYRVFSIKKGLLTITQTITAESANNETFFVQKSVQLSKSEGEEVFTEQKKSIICKIDDTCVSLRHKGSDIDASSLYELMEIINQNPNNYKELINCKYACRTPFTM